MKRKFQRAVKVIKHMLKAAYRRITPKIKSFISKLKIYISKHRKLYKITHFLYKLPGKIKRFFKVKLKSKINMKKNYWRYRFYNLRGVNPKKIAFEAYSGKEYSCNPKALYEYILKDPKYKDYEFVWAFNNPRAFAYIGKNERTTVVRRNSKQYAKEFATAKYLIFNIHYVPTYVKPKRGQVYVDTWHGKPLKKIGYCIEAKQLGSNSKHKTLKVFKKSAKHSTKILNPAPVFSEVMQHAFNLSDKKWGKKCLDVGYPRNDFLFKYTQEDVNLIKIKLKVPTDKKVILYAPTWRVTNYSKKDKKYVFKNSVDFENLKKALGDEYVILFRAHNNESRSLNMTALKDFVIDATKVKDVNELYIISDLMISDYSGTIFDYANLHRPMVYYMYDQQEYAEKVGFNFDLNELPGEIVFEEDKLAPTIQSLLTNFKYDEKYQRFNEKYNTWDSADTSKKFWESIINE